MRYAQPTKREKLLKRNLVKLLDCIKNLSTVLSRINDGLRGGTRRQSVGSKRGASTLTVALTLRALAHAAPDRRHIMHTRRMSTRRATTSTAQSRIRRAITSSGKPLTVRAIISTEKLLTRRATTSSGKPRIATATISTGLRLTRRATTSSEKPHTARATTSTAPSPTARATTSTGSRLTAEATISRGRSLRSGGQRGQSEEPSAGPPSTASAVLPFTTSACTEETSCACTAPCGYRGLTAWWDTYCGCTRSASSSVGRRFRQLHSPFDTAAHTSEVSTQSARATRAATRCMST